MSKDDQIRVVRIARLTPSQYQELEKKTLNKVQFRSDSASPVQAGVMVGVELVLRAVREGFTVE